MLNLSELCTSEQRAYIQERLAPFHQEPPSSDPQERGRFKQTLIEAANDPQIFEWEKDYVPLLNKEQLKNLPPCETLISTVGFRENPVILSILILSPKKVFLLHSKDSYPNAVRVRNDPHVRALLPGEDQVILREMSLTNAETNYALLEQEILPHTVGNVVVDPTGGTKVMVVSLSSLAFWRRIPMVYLQGHEVENVAQPFSEEILYIENPYDFHGDPDLSLLRDRFNQRAYDSALEVCERLLNTVKNERVYTRVSLLQELIRVYRDWDNFQHSSWEDGPHRWLAKRLMRVQQRMVDFQCQFVDPQALAANLTFLQALEEGWRPQIKNLCDRYRLVDLLANAYRRAELGKYDDAVARLYHCMEMAATIQLLSLGIQSTANPDYVTIAEQAGGQVALEEKYRCLMGGQPLPARNLTLRQQMTLLKIADRPVGRVYYEIADDFAERSMQVMSIRNRSYLGHGTTPVSEEDYLRFKVKAEEIVRLAIGEKSLSQLLSQATHPELESLP